MKNAAYILMIISTVLLSILLITMAWMIPMTIKTKEKIEGEHPTVALGVCAILFCGPLGIIAGILLLIANNKDCG